MNVIRKNIPNCITCMNVAAGCMAVICAFKGVGSLWGLDGFKWCFIFIGIAAVMDFMDGMAARLLGAYSDLGKELDSLCDAVSFGVAPAMLLFNLLEYNDSPEWLPYFALLIPVAGVLRLAKFNIDTRQSTSFIGLPIPANAIFWIGFAALTFDYGSELLNWFWIIPIIVLESWLMVSPICLFSLKFKNLKWKGNEWRWILMAASVIFVCAFGVTGLMWVVVAYVLLGILSQKREM